MENGGQKCFVCSVEIIKISRLWGVKLYKFAAYYFHTGIFLLTVKSFKLF